jgi:hypothetical protein
MKMKEKLIIETGNIKEGIGLDSVCTTNLLNHLPHNITAYNAIEYCSLYASCANTLAL